MDDGDPHIHVEADLGADAVARDMVASTFGLVSDLPSVVTTGCGLRVPRAMTSPRPDRVTCLACREHARRHHLRHAEQTERLGGTPGLDIGSEQARLAAEWHRDRAERFSGTDT
jgi:hypothetical protein